MPVLLALPARGPPAHSGAASWGGLDFDVARFVQLAQVTDEHGQYPLDHVRVVAEQQLKRQFRLYFCIRQCPLSSSAVVHHVSAHFGASAAAAACGSW